MPEPICRCRGGVRGSTIPMEFIMTRAHAFRSIIAAIGIVAAGAVGTILNTAEGNAQSSCSAHSLIGNASCSITCRAPSTARCTGGLFTATCECVTPPAPRPKFRLRIIIEIELDCALRLRLYLLEAYGGDLAGLTDAINSVVDAVNSGDAALYDDAENAFAQAYADASEELRRAIDEWLAANGCSDF